MEMNVSQLLREPIGSTRDFQVDEVIDITGEGKNNNKIQASAICSVPSAASL